MNISAAATSVATSKDSTTPAVIQPTPAAPLAAVAYQNDGFVVTKHGDVAWNSTTRSILRAAGGLDALTAITTLFYKKFHADRHISQFLGGVQVPLETHASRLAKYIAEMMGDGDSPWTTDLNVRPRQVIQLAGGRSEVVTSRSSAHYCAWHSVTRPAEKVGRRFKLDDCRVWMGLFFWAARDAGIHPQSADPHAAALFRYLVKWVGSFIAIYETTARRFVRYESRWSADPENTASYEAAGNFRADVVGVPLEVAQRVLSADERDNTDLFLYKDAPVVAEA